MKVQFLKTAIGILLFSVVHFLVFCQNGEMDNSIEIKELLPEGEIQFEILDSAEITARQTELAYKFQKAYQENFDVFNAYFDKTRNNQKTKFPKNKIISEKEFLEFMDFAKNIKLLPSQTEIVEVVYSDNNIISFKASGKLAEIFSQITYHIETNTFVLFDYYRLDFINFVDVKTNTNAFQEAWKGYNWNFSEAENIDLEAENLSDIFNMKNLDAVSMKQYKITLGRLMSSVKTFMIIKIKDVREGEWFTNIEVPIRMK